MGQGELLRCLRCNEYAIGTPGKPSYMADSKVCDDCVERSYLPVLPFVYLEFPKNSQGNVVAQRMN